MQTPPPPPRTPYPGHTLDEATGVYRPDHVAPFGYSDGGEDDVYAIIAACGDRSTFSDEIRERIFDWPTYYHLSEYRHNVVRPLDLAPTDRVLEIGGGCGAITRYLGETAGEVVSVEGSMSRARSIRKRCEDLPNVEVICNNIGEVDFAEKFDYVTLIGVFEYTAKYSASEAPYADALARYRGFLKPGGKLVIAIENRLGLKYFCGYNEDHLTRPYVGITDDYGASGIQTFGKRELAQLLDGAGLTAQRFAYPFPDYKFPRFTLAEAGVRREDFNVADVVAAIPAASYTGPFRTAEFDYGRAARSVARNGLIGELANSFLVVASAEAADRGRADRTDVESLGSAYNYQRRPEYYAITDFEVAGSAAGGEIRVRKRRVFGGGDGYGGVELATGESAYVYGELLTTRLAARPGDAVAVLRPYVDFVGAYIAAHGASDAYDLAPRNVVVRPSGGLAYVDREWVVTAESLTARFVAYRGLSRAHRTVLGGDGADALAFVNAVLAAAGWTPVGVEEAEAFDAQEARIQRLITPEAKGFRLYPRRGSRLRQDVRFKLRLARRILERKLDL